MFRQIRFKFLIGGLTVIVSLASSCKNNAAPAEETADVITPVTITPVMYKTVTSTVDLPAISTFMNKSIIRATTAGTIQKVLATQGENISAHQQLFTIRTQESMALNNNSAIDTALSFNGLIKINSPKEGVISSVSYQSGDFVQEGDELAVVSEKNSLVFILDVPFEFEKYINKNRNCNISLPDTKQIKGTITGRLPEMNAETQTIRYMIKPAADDDLPANLIADVALMRSTKNNALVLPKQAILSDETQTEFWVMKLLNDTVAVKVDILKGFENNDEVEITDPVFLPSDRIILTGNYGLPDTARITIINK